MGLVWDFSENTGNEKWKGLTWGMLPLHASGIAACTYHFFYNPSSLQFLVTTQAGLTLLGNITCAIAAYRIAISNGWSLSELNPLPASSTSPKGLIVENAATMPLELSESSTSNVALAAKVAAPQENHCASIIVLMHGARGTQHTQPHCPHKSGAAGSTSHAVRIPAAYFPYYQLLSFKL